jgi:hypothetical protein
LKPAIRRLGEHVQEQQEVGVVILLLLHREVEAAGEVESIQASITVLSPGTSWLHAD